MSSLADRLSKMSAIKLALAAAETRAKTSIVNAEPLAIIGVGCRFPGNADDPDSFWRLLSEGVDAISEVPAERWDVDAFYDPVPHTPGKMISRCGGFVGNLREFDAGFFGISPREATSLDPQQRTLLEVAWETFENAGIPPHTLLGTTTGVFVGISGIDYFMHMQACNHEIDAYVGTGNALSVASGRLSYVFGLQGPSISVDTACSSSLVSIHLACQSLRNRECDLALAGGTHRIILPHGSIGLSQAHLLAPDGRCKTFDSSADGYVRGEGCGVILLKRLSDAIADGDTIAALIRGSAVNQDGKTSGLTVPNGPAQQAVIRKALANAAVDANQVGYLEVHGTGTPLGDPIEVTAVAGVFGRGRAVEHPLLIGSVKTNFGHLEAAAGIAGLLKVVLSLQHKEIPPHLHFHSPNPHIPWTSLPIEVAARRQPWPIVESRRIGGVSSFSFSGTNAHAVLEEAPSALLLSANRSDGPAWTPHLLTLSAKTPQALRDLALRYQEYFSARDREAVDAFEAVCYTASIGRTHFSQRLSVLADSVESAQDALSSWIAGTKGPSVFEGRRTKPTKVGFFFSGQAPGPGSIGYELSDRQPHFRSALEQTHEIWRGEFPLVDLFAVEVALAGMWRGLGIDADVVAAQGVGEFAAACFAGVFSFDAALQLLLAWYRTPDSAKREQRIRSIAEGIIYSKPRLTWVSAATGRRITNEVCEAEYWIQRLHDTSETWMKSFDGDDCDTVVAMGASDGAATAGSNPTPLSATFTVPTLSSGAADWQALMKGLAVLYACGASPDWKALYEAPLRRVVIPTYPFQRDRFWVDGVVGSAERLHTAVPSPPPSRAGSEHLDRAALLNATVEQRRTMLDAYLTGHLADILKRPQDAIDQHEPLQSVGLDSLMAAELKYRIEADLAITLEIRSFQADYSLAHLTDDVLSALDGSRTTTRAPNISLARSHEGAPLVSLLAAHEEGQRLPLFFIHPGGIDISTYVALASHLAPDQPLFVLQPHGLYGGHFENGENVIEASIAHAASLCLAEVLQRRPYGPYCLAGWSMGGLVAYEMTQQLQSGGHDVALLTLLDVTCGPARDGSTLVAWFADLLEARTARRLNYSFDELLKLDVDRQIESIWARAVAVEAVHPAMPLDEFRFLFDKYKDALVASSHRTEGYKLNPELCADRIVFFNCAELAKPERRAVESVFGWNADSTNVVETHAVPGNHYTMLFEPAVAVLAAGIQRCLDQIEASTRDSSLASAHVEEANRV